MLSPVQMEVVVGLFAEFQELGRPPGLLRGQGVAEVGGKPAGGGAAKAQNSVGDDLQAQPYAVGASKQKVSGLSGTRSHLVGTKLPAGLRGETGDRRR